MNDELFLAHLKINYPYLYDIELRVREIRAKTGFGEVSTSLTVRYSKVEISDIGGWSKTVYREKR